MSTLFKFKMLVLLALGFLLAACSQSPKLVAPEIDPPTDLIPGYVPKGFELISGFQLSGTIPWPIASDAGEVSMPGLLGEKLNFANFKSPDGNDIQGVYYQGKENLLLITKSYFPKGTLDLWMTTYEASWSRPCECGCFDLRLDGLSLPTRMAELQEERTIDGVQVAILKGPQGWTTVLVRGEYLITVESGISLEENLKVVASLLGG